MTDREYVAAQFQSDPGGPSFTRVVQVTLNLRADGSFTLLQGEASSDWGDRAEAIRRYTGQYTESGREVVCRATRCDVERRWSDHEMGTSGSERTEEAPDGLELTFAARLGGLVCPLEGSPLQGVVLSPHLSPHPQLTPSES